MKYSSYRRKVYLINKNFQVKFLLYSVFISFITISVFYAMIYRFYEYSRQLGHEMGFPQGHIFFRFIEDQKTDMGSFFLITSIIVFLFIVISGIWYSHRIAGPIYRINNQLKTIAMNKIVDKISFRKKDFFQELAISYNKRLHYLRTIATESPEALINELKYKESQED
jgi:methyl-accepting chemotaxis protein